MSPLFETDDYIVLRTRPEEFIIFSDKVYPEFISEARRLKASLVYSDYYSVNEEGRKSPHPLTDYLPGSLRDDFDFGAIVCADKKDYDEWKSQTDSNDFYSLRLFLSARKGVARIRRQLYGLRDYDPRRSGEKQFDYVDRKNRNVQISMEKTCTDFLRKEGLYLTPRTKISAEDSGKDSFTVEASVVIPVFNRAATISDAVHSALGQKTDFEYNVIVVDNFSTDGTSELLKNISEEDNRLIVLRPEEKGLGIGGCWNLAVFSKKCGHYAVQLDSDDVYSGPDSLQKIIGRFRTDGSAMVIGTYMMTDFNMNPIKPGIIDHREWTDENGHNNALRINGLGAPRAFSTSALRNIGGFPNVSYGEDYAVGLRITREYKISRIYEPIYNCRRWGGNSDAALDVESVNRNNYYKDSLRTEEILERMAMVQRNSWKEADSRYAALDCVETKSFGREGFRIYAEYNPARAVSTLADTDNKSIALRPCFLCDENRPPVQKGLKINMEDRRYQILLNPFPIFPKHFTVPAADHQPQKFSISRYEDMLRLSEIFTHYLIFYNGPESGASAPDHFHFQMGCKGFIPLEKDFKSLKKREIGSRRGSRIYMPEEFLETAVIIDSDSSSDSVQCFSDIFKIIGSFCGGTIEPMLNLLSWKSDGRYITVIIPRSAHRPECYYASGENRVRVSPASVDLGGTFIVPVKDEFDRFDEDLMKKVIREVTPLNRRNEIRNALETCFNRRQNEVSIGLMTEAEIKVNFRSSYSGTEGLETFTAEGGRIVWNGKSYSELIFIPDDYPSASFELKGVTIGVNFHWQRKENQIFRGSLKLLPVDDKVLAINVIGVEDYLYSVISSEMSGKGSPEFLKAHAVISRSWLLARPTISGKKISPVKNNKDKNIKWYDRDDHTLFDVCADDHCQRYQGLVRSGDKNVAAAIDGTWGEVLKYGGEICDTRFSKCCGGISERFDTCWEDKNYPYLKPVRDVDHAGNSSMPDLSVEENARKWILDRPESFCNTSDRLLLEKIMNSYDVETADFYRWKVEYSQKEISALVKKRSGIDFGDIIALTPEKRGASGRICELEIKGTLRTMVIGKELEIRRTLSESHLYSSAFIVDTEGAEDSKDGSLKVPARFILRGAGWGHGVGLCQIGAAAMGEKGYNYKEILLHYFSGASLEKVY